MAHSNQQDSQLTYFGDKSFEVSNFKTFHVYATDIIDPLEKIFYHNLKLLEAQIKSPRLLDRLSHFIAFKLKFHKNLTKDTIHMDTIFFPLIIFKIFMEPPLDYLTQIFDAAFHLLLTSFENNFSAEYTLFNIKKSLYRVTLNYTLRELVKLNYSPSPELYCKGFPSLTCITSNWLDQEDSKLSFLTSSANASLQRLTNLLNTSSPEQGLLHFLLSRTAHSTLLHVDPDFGLFIPVRIFPPPIITFVKTLLTPRPQNIENTAETKSIVTYDRVSSSLYKQVMNNVNPASIDRILN